MLSGRGDDQRQPAAFRANRQHDLRVTLGLCRQILSLPMSPTDELVVVEVAGSQPEAEMLCSLLRSAGIACMPRLTSRGAGAGDGLGIGGQHEIMVRSKDAQAARKILRGPG